MTPEVRVGLTILCC